MENPQLTVFMKLKILATAILLAPFYLPTVIRAETSPTLKPLQPVWVAQAQWTQLSPKDGSFTILMPGKATEESEKATTEGVTTEDRTFTVEREDSAFILGYSEFAEDISMIKPEALLEAAVEGLLQEGGKILSQRPISLNSYSGREVEYQSRDGITSNIRVYMVGQRLYQLYAITPRAGEVKKFFDSFQVKQSSAE